MLARSVWALPDTDGWAFEPKMDGFRAVLTVPLNGQVSLMSRSNKPLSAYFPEIVDAAGQLPRGLRLDGELVISRGGGVQFGALQERLHPAAQRVRDLAIATPASFIAFDVLAVGASDVRDQPYRSRRWLLVDTITNVSPRVGVMPMTTDRVAAQAWLSGHVPGIEGVVAKRLDQLYRPGLRGWYRVRLVNTGEAVVAGVAGPRERPEALILGRTNSGGSLLMTGRTGRLALPDRIRIGALLRSPVRGRHPWPTELPSGRFGQIPGGEVAYTQVEPELVVEFEYDTAVEHGRLRHPAKFIRVRPDLEVTDLKPWP
jgi:ATP-dependent DNA ligase